MAGVVSPRKVTAKSTALQPLFIRLVERSRRTELVQNRDVSCNIPMQTDATLPDDTSTLEHTVRALDRDALTDRDLPNHTDDPLPPPVREGLPKNYRSRHDRHYVEQLISSTGMPLLRMLAVSRIDAANLPDPEETSVHGVGCPPTADSSKSM
jgi:hypothetical protein